MNYEPIILKEFESISVNLDGDDVVFLNKFHDKHLNIKQISNGEFEIKAKSYVGLIELPSKRKIIINPKIAISNLLYLFAFTYDLVKFKGQNKNNITENNSLIDFYILVFLNWLEILRKKGLGKRYETEADRLSAVKGKIPISENLEKSNKIYCEYDELTFSTPENKIIKATLGHILKQKMLSSEIQQRAGYFYRLLAEIANVQLSTSLFNSIVYNKLNNQYKPIIDLCKLIYENSKLTDEAGNNIFSGFIADMNVVKDSYKKDWAIPVDDYLPQIHPDILVKDKAVIDAKYYKTPLTTYGKFITEHIYQIMFYLQAYQINKGILVYPQPEDEKNEDIDMCYDVNNQKLRFFCIPLHKEPSDIEKSIKTLSSYVV